MKSSIVIFIIFIATVVTSVLCSFKFMRHPDEMDLIAKTAAGINNVIPEGGAVSLRLIHTKTEYELFVRYFLPTRHLYQQISSDTVLIINGNHYTDSVMAYVINGRKILWQNSDSLNTYTLVSSH